MIDIPDSADLVLKLTGFVPTERLEGGHCSHVFATEDQVLKVPFQGEEMTTGLTFQRFLSERGIGPRIICADPATGCLLMERAKPGLKLHETGLSELQQLYVWRDLVWRIRQSEKLLRNPTENASPFERFAALKLMSLRNFVNMKDRLASHLFAWSDEGDYLHGDLHHENILSHGVHWLVIDAKGLQGDRAFEGAAYIRNPISEVGKLTVDEMREKIIRVSAALQVDKFRVWGWTVAQLRDGLPEPGSSWHHVLKLLYELAPEFGGERFVEPLT